MKRKLLLFLGLIVLSLGCQKDQKAAEEMPDQVAGKLSIDEDYLALTDNVAELAIFVQDNAGFFTKNSEKIMALKTETAVMNFLKANQIGKVAELSRENNVLSARLNKKYPALSKMNKIELVKMVGEHADERNKKTSLQMSIEGSISVEDPESACTKRHATEQNRCVRNMMIEAVANAIITVFSSGIGVVTWVHNMTTYGLCITDADDDFSTCMRAAGLGGFN